jgi:hypothetical protein
LARADWRRSDFPTDGEHTVEVLASAGMTAPEIDALLASGVAVQLRGPAFARR